MSLNAEDVKVESDASDSTESSDSITCDICRKYAMTSAKTNTPIMQLVRECIIGNDEGAWLARVCVWQNDVFSYLPKPVYVFIPRNCCLLAVRTACIQSPHHACVFSPACLRVPCGTPPT